MGIATIVEARLIQGKDQENLNMSETKTIQWEKGDDGIVIPDHRRSQPGREHDESRLHRVDGSDRRPPRCRRLRHRRDHHLGQKTFFAGGDLNDLLAVTKAVGQGSRQASARSNRSCAASRRSASRSWPRWPVRRSAAARDNARHPSPDRGRRPGRSSSVPRKSSSACCPAAAGVVPRYGCSVWPMP